MEGRIGQSYESMILYQYNSAALAYRYTSKQTSPFQQSKCSTIRNIKMDRVHIKHENEYGLSTNSTCTMQKQVNTQNQTNTIIVSHVQVSTT
jgi:Tfp pilus assembly protein PilW